MNIEIADRLQKLRKERGLSQEELANQLGISRQAVSKWERAESSPDTDNLICLAKLYGISLDELLKTDDTVEDLKPDETNEKDSKEISVKCGISNSILVFVISSVYFAFSIAFNIWHPLWIIFLFIPIISSLVEAIRKSNPHNFAYPVLLTAIYLFLGCVYKLWHPWWVIFVTIPLYYAICDLFKQDGD